MLEKTKVKIATPISSKIAKYIFGGFVYAKNSLPKNPSSFDLNVLCCQTFSSSTHKKV